MDASGLYGQHGLLKCRSSFILSTLVHTGPIKNFFTSLTTGAIPVFFNYVFLFFRFFCGFLSQTREEPFICPFLIYLKKSSLLLFFVKLVDSKYFTTFLPVF